MVIAGNFNDTGAALASSPGLTHAENSKGTPGSLCASGGRLARISRIRYLGRDWHYSRSQFSSPNRSSSSKKERRRRPVEHLKSYGRSWDTSQIVLNWPFEFFSLRWILA